jgi:hypothetical protein
MKSMLPMLPDESNYSVFLKRQRIRDLALLPELYHPRLLQSTRCQILSSSPNQQKRLLQLFSLQIGQHVCEGNDWLGIAPFLPIGTQEVRRTDLRGPVLPLVMSPRLKNPEENKTFGSAAANNRFVKSV